MILTILYSIGTSLFYFHKVITLYPPTKRDDVVEWESRLETLKNEIPADQITISYVSEWDRLGFNKDVNMEFSLTQYALAPRHLVRNLNNEWIVANSSDPEFIDWLSDKIKGPFTSQWFGNGLYLIHQEK